MHFYYKNITQNICVTIVFSTDIDKKKLEFMKYFCYQVDLKAYIYTPRREYVEAKDGTLQLIASVITPHLMSVAQITLLMGCRWNSCYSHGFWIMGSQVSTVQLFVTSVRWFLFHFRSVFYIMLNFLVRFKEHLCSGNMEDQDETERTLVIAS